ncbi:hypothetical protein AKJ50_00760, partial [candidate division MSBL1 archaeon SCGC-AAA382A13]
MKEKILKLLKRKGEDGILQSNITNELNLSKSTVSTSLSQLEKENKIYREKVAGKSKRVWLLDRVPHSLDNLIRIGIIRAAEYPHVVLAAKQMNEKSQVRVFDDAREATRALDKGQIDIAFTPLRTQIYHSLVNQKFKIYAGCARKGCGIIARSVPSENTAYASSSLSTMEMNLKRFLEERELNPYRMNITYFKTPGEIFRSYLRGEVEAVSIWEPYLSLLRAQTENPLVFPPTRPLRTSPCCTLGVNNRFIEKNEVLFKKFLEEYIDASEKFKKRKFLEKGADMLAERTNLDKNLLLASFENYEFTYRLREEKILNYVENFDLKIDHKT